LIPKRKKGVFHSRLQRGGEKKGKKGLPNRLRGKGCWGTERRRREKREKKKKRIFLYLRKGKGKRKK